MRSLPWGLAVVAALAGPVRADEAGLRAYYTFDEGSGFTTRDRSGNGNDGRIRGARFVRRGSGYCLDFDGVDDYVDCGEGPSLDIRGPITLEAWVLPARRVQGEPGILGKHFSSYLLTYYADGKCWWYVNDGGNNCKAAMTPDSWHHVAASFDGSVMRLYLDGKPAYRHRSAHNAIRSGKRFFIGCVVGDPEATDPAYTRTAYFPGMVDEVRVYARALSEAEVRVHFQAGLKTLALVAPWTPAPAVTGVRRGGLTVCASAGGQLRVEAGGETCVLESAFSYPGESIGWNRLAGGREGSEKGWRPRVTRRGDGLLAAEARGKGYTLSRRITVRPGRVEVQDRLTNPGRAPTALVVRHALTAPGAFREAFAPGGAENPTLFLAGRRGGWGIVVEDDLGRLRFDPSVGLPRNQARFRVGPLALDSGKAYTLCWRLYRLPKGADYFELVNRIRCDWRTNFTVEGPFSFFDVGSPLLNDPQALRSYLTRRRLGIAALTPWLDYDPGSFDHVWPRAEYRERMRRAIRAIKAADPRVKCVGCIETDWVTIYPDRIPGGERLPSYGTGSGLLNTEQTRILDRAGLPWRDSVKRRADGNLTLELYTRGGKPQTALAVYPALGNAQYRFLLDQIRFLLDDVGMDGYYIDEFSQGWAGGIPSYSGWDGWSAELDPRTGRMGRRFVDCSLAGIEARVHLCRYALDRGKIVVANTYATSLREQALPVNRFAETQGSFDPHAVPEGQEPPAVADLYRGNLASPIGLGIVGAPDDRDTARRLMRAVITYLRHGTLYYHYVLGDLPETGEGSGEYGPINHMFPLTPRALHKGWIEGRERIVTCVSGSYQWPQRERPVVLRFDLHGRQVPHHFPVTRAGHGWQVNVGIRSWAEIAVIGGGAGP